MSPEVAHEKGERAFAFSALLWSLGTITLASMALVQAGSDEPSVHGLWALLLGAALFAPALVLGFRARFVLGRRGVSTRLRRLSGGLSAICFVVGWVVLSLAYIADGDSAVYATIRHGMPTTTGLSFAVISIASFCLLLWECLAAIAEIREVESKRNLVLSTVLSLTMALICVAALSGVVVGRIYFFGGS